jgi:CoA-transferase family III
MGKAAAGTAHGPLAGIRIVDLTSIVLGPSATQMLGDLGADEITVEPPAGDPMRTLGPQRATGLAAHFVNFKRSKRSATLDLKTPAAACALRPPNGSVLVPTPCARAMSGSSTPMPREIGGMLQRANVRRSTMSSKVRAALPD